jgi:hypothetical protein
MAYDRFLIAPINSGLETAEKPWLIPDDAFANLENAYIYRGRVRKRFGSVYTGSGAAIYDKYSRSQPAIDLAYLGAGVGITDAAGNATAVLPNKVPGSLFKVGQHFSIGAYGYNVVQIGAPAAMISTKVGSTATFNTTTGEYTFTNAEPLKHIFFYPAEPIMGLTLYEQEAIIDHDAYAFDTQFVYKFSFANQWLSPNAAQIWHGNNSQFFWSTNWTGANTSEIRLFVSNYNATINAAPGANDDPIYSYDGTTWAAFKPKFKTAGTGNVVQTARIILPFKDRLLLLNTVESNEANNFNYHYAQRCRYSHNGVPFPAAPTNLGPTVAGVLAGNVGAPSYGLPWQTGVFFSIGNYVYTVVNPTPGVQTMTTTGPTGGGIVYTFDVATGAFNFTGAPAGNVYFYPTGSSPWLENNQPGWDGAGWIDATTDEEIIGAEFIKDRLIVYFENSTWELAYTGNQVQPFVWQKLNTELGAVSTFSLIPFDKMVLGIGINGVHACNGANVERIDNKIPLKIYDLRRDNEGVKRVHGIRDYATECVYWTFPDTSAMESSNTYPNKVMLYNYSNDTWAFNDDTFTCFGYFETTSDRIWMEIGEEWGSIDYTWVSGIVQAGSRQIIAGTPGGAILQLDPDRSENASSIRLTNIIQVGDLSTLTLVNHTLQDGDYIMLEAAGVNVGGVAVQSLILNGHPVPVTIVDANTVTTLDLGPMEGPYVGGGKAIRVSRIDILTKQLNPYNKQGKNVYLAKVDFCVESTDSGAIVADYAPSSSNLYMISQAAASGAILGTNILEMYPYPGTIEIYQDQLWHPVYFQTEGSGIQLHLTLSDGQMHDKNVATSDFQLEGMVLYTQPVGRLA